MSVREEEMLPRLRVINPRRQRTVVVRELARAGDQRAQVELSRRKAMRRADRRRRAREWRRNDAAVSLVVFGIIVIGLALLWLVLTTMAK